MDRLDLQKRGWFIILNGLNGPAKLSGISYLYGARLTSLNLRELTPQIKRIYKRTNRPNRLKGAFPSVRAFNSAAGP
jgi:hypothetical protein